MISSIRLKNFKPFADRSLSFKPLTLLSGLNSTGKSSVLQALLLMRQSYQLPSKTTPESDSRIQQFRQQLTIKCPDSKERLFSWHLRMTPGAWRLYFSEELGPGKIIIGYIGLKLLKLK